MYKQNQIRRMPLLHNKEEIQKQNYDNFHVLNKLKYGIAW